MTISQIRDLLIEEYIALDHYVDECWDREGHGGTTKDVVTLQMLREMLEICSPERFDLLAAEVDARVAAAEAEQDSDEDPF